MKNFLRRHLKISKYEQHVKLGIFLVASVLILLFSIFAPPGVSLFDKVGMELALIAIGVFLLRFPTGIFLELPEGYEAQVRARSGLAIKRGIGLVNGIGTVDSDYRGELKVPLINWGEEEFVINSGDRIAQVVVCRFEQVRLEPVEELDSTERGSGGFGHTGV